MDNLHCKKNYDYTMILTDKKISSDRTGKIGKGSYIK